MYFNVAVLYGAVKQINTTGREKKDQQFFKVFK